MRPASFLPHEKSLIQQVVTWVRVVNEARQAGSPPIYPSPDDAEASLLFRRIRRGLAPLAWAPPTRQGHPAYELIEDARNEHPVERFDTEGEHTVVLDGARWRVLARSSAEECHVGFGSWPLSFRLQAHLRPRWSQLPANWDKGNDQDMVLLGSGQLVTRATLKAEADVQDPQWFLRCVSPLNEMLYLQGERLPVDTPDHFAAVQVWRDRDGVAEIFECQPYGKRLRLFLLARDAHTEVGRYLVSDIEGDIEAQCAQMAGGRSPLEFLPVCESREVYEIDAAGLPRSGWRARDPLWLLPPE